VDADVITRPLRILELRSVRGVGGGPEKTILLGSARSDPRRFAVTVCYLRDARDTLFTLDRAAAQLPVDYVEIRERHSFDRGIWGPLRQLIRDRRIDIVHAHDYKTDFLAFALSRVEPILPLSTVHGWSGYSPRERLIYYPADRLLLRRFPAVIAVSSPIRARLIGAGVPAGRVTTVLNGIDPQAFRRRHEDDARMRAELKVPPAAIVVGAIGRLEIEKRYDLLLDAVAQLRGSRPTLRLVFVGDGSLHEPLVAQARALGIADLCVFTGRRTDVADLAHAFDVLVQTSDTEGTPNAVLEAMALEVPVVATAVGGTSDLITNEVHGLLVPRRQPAAIAAAIERTLDDAGATAMRVAAARQRIEGELAFETRMRAVENVYMHLATERAAHTMASGDQRHA
jgi:glycosyltransferase involved in cell wall biosynthesis